MTPACPQGFFVLGVNRVLAFTAYQIVVMTGTVRILASLLTRGR
jgi:hypothetical protein